ncbi:MAG: short-chain dehydrogenase [Alphaproteobacteria bacterium HGW-Alphaproteobacteria-2]|nr:MAG: short-chain dehydrogenase [Alphaproteobacteria bacterium HGW-Alphaproteobacteria-2]
MSGSAARMRAWAGPAILSVGFRPFFLLAGIWAALAMALWLAILAGALALPTAFDPVAWHAHEFLWGYLGAVATGFLLTAVPNWTGRLPITGWGLAGLAGLWLVGRVAVAVSAHLPPLAVALADLAFLLALAGVLLREIIAGRNWHNLMVVALLALLLAGNAAFHWSAAQGGTPASGMGLRLGIAAAVMMIALIGGRIVPSFTRNWLAGTGRAARPAPFGAPDRAALATGAAALAAWVLWPAALATGVLCLLAGVLHALRLSRWAGRHTGTEALVWVLHAGYGFVPLGFLAMGAALMGLGGANGAQHLWMAGGIGVMTLAVMTRASLGHSGRALHAGAGTAAVYLLAIAAVLARALYGWLPEQALLQLSGAAWIAAFGLFSVLYWPVLALPRLARRGPN